MSAFSFGTLPVIGVKRTKPARSFVWRTRGDTAQGSAIFSFCGPSPRNLPPEGGIGVRGFRPCERRKCTFARCLHGLSPSPEGLFFSAQPPNFPSRTSPVMPTAFVGTHKSGRILPFRHTSRLAIILGQFAISFSGKIDFRGKLLSVPLTSEQVAGKR